MKHVFPCAARLQLRRCLGTPGLGILGKTPSGASLRESTGNLAQRGLRAQRAARDREDTGAFGDTGAVLQEFRGEDSVKSSARMECLEP